MNSFSAKLINFNNHGFNVFMSVQFHRITFSLKPEVTHLLMKGIPSTTQLIKTKTVHCGTPVKPTVKLYIY